MLVSTNFYICLHKSLNMFKHNLTAVLNLQRPDKRNIPIVHKDHSSSFQLILDNSMKHEGGAGDGSLFYPDFYLPFNQVKNLFVVTGIFRSNIITIIN